MSPDIASNEREVSLGNSGVAIFPFEFSKGAGCIGDVKGDPIGDRLTSQASSFIVCSGVLGVSISLISHSLYTCRAYIS